MSGTVLLQEPLDGLQRELNTVFFQVGRIFKTAHEANPRALNNAKLKAKQGIPRAAENFHDALDAVEKDLFRAKAVFERDLKALREKRAERERVAGAARLQPGNRSGPNAVTASTTAKGGQGPAKGIKLEPGLDDAVGKGQQGGNTGDAAATAAAVAAAAAASSSAAAPPPGQMDGNADTSGMDLKDDLGGMWTDDLAGMIGGGGDGTANVGDAHDTSTDALFGEDMDFGDNFDGTDDNNGNLLSGLHKYVNAGQNGFDAGNGGDAGAATTGTTGAADDVFDLDAILGDINNDGNEDSNSPSKAAAEQQQARQQQQQQQQGGQKKQGAAAAAQAKAGDAANNNNKQDANATGTGGNNSNNSNNINNNKNTTNTTNNASNDNPEASSSDAAAQFGLGAGSADDSAMDLSGGESLFDLGFDLTADTGDAGAMSLDDSDFADLFNFS